MGDRTTVELTVLDEHAAFVREADDGGEEMPNDDGTIAFIFYEVNYADLDYGCSYHGNKGIVELMTDAKIPYDIEWEPGCEYPAGSMHFRILEDGETSFVEVACRESRGMVPIQDVFEIIRPALLDPGVTSYAVDAVNELNTLYARILVEEYPAMTLVENREYLS